MDSSGCRLRQRPRTDTEGAPPGRGAQLHVASGLSRDAQRRRERERSKAGGNARAPGVDATGGALVTTAHHALLDLMRVAPRQSEAEEVEDEENEEAQGSKTTQKRPTKKRKATHTIRNEEIAALSSEIAVMTKRLAFLRGKALEAPPDRESTEQNPDYLEHPLVPNPVLREGMGEQQLWLAGARSMVTEYCVNDFVTPAHCYIHLTRSPADRERYLHSIKLQQIRLARRYVLERSRCMDVTKPYGDGQRFINHKGDTCSLRYSILQLPGSLTVRQVFDVALFFTENLEISFTDGAGCVTIRENDDNEGSDPQHRYLTTLPPETLVEGNLMLFTHFDEDDDYGIVATPFVDRDDLHPYRPKERIRQDIMAVLLVTREHGQIIIRRLGYVRIHRNDHFTISDDTMRQLTLGATRWGDSLIKHVKDVYKV